MNTIKFVRAHPSARVPQRACENDAGFDLMACEPFVLGPSNFGMISTGIRIEQPAGTCCLVLPRSGLALRHGVTVLNSPGLIDAGYRGIVGVVLVNHGKQPFHIEVGDRIAQLLFLEAKAPVLMEVDVLGESERGVGGFGHTGVAAERDSVG